MYKNLLSTRDIITRFGNNCEVDLRIDLTVLKAQVHVIRMSKAIANSKRLVELTGISDEDLSYIMQNEQQIMRKWQKVCKNALNSTHSDDCDGIDALILEWISQYKTKPAPLAIKSIAMNLADILSIYPYFIKPSVWTKINEIFTQPNGATNQQSCSRPLSLLGILKKDGSRILMPETYNRFLKSIGENSKVDDNNAKSSQGDINIKDIRMGKQSTSATDMNPSTSFSDFPPRMDINVLPENAETDMIKIEDENLEYTDDKTKSNTLSTGHIKRQIIDDIKTERLDEYSEYVAIKEETQANENFKVMDSCAKFVVVKEENVFDEDKQDFDSTEFISSGEENCEATEVHLKSINISREKMTESNKQIKMEPHHVSSQQNKILTICHGLNGKNEESLTKTFVEKGIKNDGNGIVASKCKKIDAANKSYNMSGSATYKQNEVESTLNTYSQEIKIENTSVNVSDNSNIVSNIKNEENYEILELEEPNHETINIYPIKYVEDVNIVEDAVKQELKYFDNNNEFDNINVSTFSDLFSDDDETDVKCNTNLTGQLGSQLQNHSNEWIPEQRPKHLKRSIHESDDNLPSTSQSSILNHHPFSSEFSKKSCLGILKAEDETGISIKSKAQAYDCLHSIKSYLQSQNDTVGISFISDIMISFMLCNDTRQWHSS